MDIQDANANSVLAQARVLRRASTHTSASDRYNPEVASINRCSRDFSFIEDALVEGDRIGNGLELQGELVSTIDIPVSFPASLLSPDHRQPADHFQVVRKLGAGSYAVVYLAREVLPNGSGLGREYAIKCISRHGLDSESLEAQMLEATIQQALPPHPNVVTLYRTYSTSSFLLLLLEYVPGEDLFYFLEQAKDHEDINDESLGNPSTPPTPSILASLHPSQLLSNRRLHLVSSMFSQMCEAVAACHRAGVFHRDIKPENFIVTDGQQLSASGDYERRVVVKLTDFGLATRDVESADVDCGSAPYMSYECRNNIAPTYTTAPADVWSLGIVLLNMLYHHNPWADTSKGVCASFTYYQQDPVAFFMQRFPGMTIAVAQFFSNRVFCILDPVKPQRITAHDFGLWARNLPRFLGPDARWNASIAFQNAVHASSPTPASKVQPKSEAVAYAESVVFANAVMDESEPRRSSVSSYRDKAPPPLSSLPPLDPPVFTNMDGLSEGESEGEEKPTSRTSTGQPQKRRKRGARGGKGSQVHTPTTANATPLFTPDGPGDLKLDQIAQAVQIKAREMSTARNHSRHTSISTGPPSIAPSTTSSGLSKKKKKEWGFFRKDSGSDHEFFAGGITTTSLDDFVGIPTDSNADPKKKDAGILGGLPAPTMLAQNVGSILMSLDPEPVAPPKQSSASIISQDSGRSWSRGRKKNPALVPPNAIPEVEPKMSTKSSLDNRRRAPSAPAPDRNTSWRSKSIERVTPVPGTVSGPTTPTTPNYHYQKVSQLNSHNYANADAPPVPELPASYRPYNLASNNAILNNTSNIAGPSIPSTSVFVPSSPPMVNVTPYSFSSSSTSSSATIVPATAPSSSFAYSSAHYQPPALKSSAASIRSTSTMSTSVSSNFWGSNARSSGSNWSGSKYAGSVRSVSTAATSVSAGSENWRERAPKPQSNIKQMDGIPRELDRVPRGPGEHHRSNKGKGSANPDGPPVLRNKASSKGKLSSFAPLPLDTITEKPKSSASFGGDSPLDSVDSGLAAVPAVSPLQEVSRKVSIGSKSRLWSRFRTKQ